MKKIFIFIFLLTILLVITGCSQMNVVDEIVIDNQGDHGAIVILDLSKSEEGEYSLVDWYDIYYMTIYKDSSKDIVSADGKEVTTSLDYHLEYYESQEEKVEIIERYNLK